jgi:hypothetical protein
VYPVAPRDPIIITRPIGDTTGVLIDLTGENTVLDLRGTQRFVDLAPMIHRQRMVIEGTCRQEITESDIVGYLRDLGGVTDMLVLTEPVTHRSDRYGWAGWVHWETSGAHFYAWESPLIFFSVDIYTCKAFDPERTLQFTRDFFSATALTSKSW